MLNGSGPDIHFLLGSASEALQTAAAVAAAASARRVLACVWSQQTPSFVIVSLRILTYVRAIDRHQLGLIVQMEKFCSTKTIGFESRPVDSIRI